MTKIGPQPSNNFGLSWTGHGAASEAARNQGIIAPLRPQNQAPAPQNNNAGNAGNNQGNAG